MHFHFFFFYKLYNIHEANHLRVAANISRYSLTEGGVPEDSILLAGHLCQELDHLWFCVIGNATEVLWIYVHAECTHKALPIQKSHQDPHHGGQKTPLDHG